MSNGAGPDFDLRLIELVRANPSLYERELRTTPYESSRKRKFELWCSIAASLKVDANTCITRWKNLYEKLCRELVKEQAGGTGSEWSLLPKLRFAYKQINSHNSERQPQKQQQNASTTVMQNINVSWRALSPEQLIEEVHDEDDALQEAMDEQQCSLRLERETDTNGAHIIVQEPLVAAPIPVVTPQTSAELLKRIEALLEGLGTANRNTAEKRILAYLCKCNLRALNNEQIDDIFI